MMYYSVILVFLLVFFDAFNSYSTPNRFERLDISYTGCVTNKSTIIAYGSEGTLTISRNDGKDWIRKTVAKSGEAIQTIRYSNGLFIGFTTKKNIISSDDDGNTWKTVSIFSLDTIVDLSVTSGVVYIASKSTIYKVDLSKGVLFDSLYNSLWNIEHLYYLNNKLLVADGLGKLWFYSLPELKLERYTDFKLLSFCSNCSAPSNVVLYNDTIFCLINQSILYSPNNGQNWSLLTEFGGLFVVGESGLYKTTTIITNPSKYFAVPVTFHFESGSFKQVGSMNMERLTKHLFFTQVILKGSDTLIGVGYYNTIFISPDLGKTWHVISNFSPYWGAKWLDNNIGFVTGAEAGRIFRTTDGGATWLPQLNNSETNTNISYHTNIFFDSTGIGLTVGRINVTDSSYYTKDFGNSYKKTGIRLVLGFETNVFRFGDTYSIFTTNESKYKPGHLLYRVDSSFEGGKVKVLDSLWIATIERGNNDTLWSWMIDYSTKNMVQYSYSTDYGTSWVVMRSYNNSRVDLRIKSTSFFSYTIKKFGRYLACIKYEPFADVNNLYVFDTEEGVWLADSLNVKNCSAYYMFEFNQKYYILYTGKNINYFLFGNSFSNFSNWEIDSLIPNRLIEIQGNTKNNVYCSVSDLKFELYHSFKMFVDSTVVTSTTEEITENRNVLSSFAPYPNPATHTVRTHIYWDQSREFNLKGCVVYNSLGEVVENSENMMLNKLDTYHGEIIWNCGHVSAGAYYIQVRHGNAQIVLPIIVYPH